MQGAACSEDVAEGQGPKGRVAPRRATVDGQTLGIGQTCGPERLELVSSMGPIYVIYIYIYDYICHIYIYMSYTGRPLSNLFYLLTLF